MARTTNVNIVRRGLEVTEYDGSNERLNAIHDGENVLIVQGSYGRVPLIADTEEEARERYVARFFKFIEEDAEDSDLENATETDL